MTGRFLRVTMKKTYKGEKNQIGIGQENEKNMACIDSNDSNANDFDNGDRVRERRGRSFRK